MERRKLSRWTQEEKERLREAIKLYGTSNWNKIAEYVSTRNNNQCHQHWYRVLSPTLIKAPWTPEEIKVLTARVRSFGENNWTKIAEGLPGRTDIACRQKWLVVSGKCKGGKTNMSNSKRSRSANNTINDKEDDRVGSESETEVDPSHTTNNNDDDGDYTPPDNVAESPPNSYYPSPLKAKTKRQKLKKTKPEEQHTMTNFETPSQQLLQQIQHHPRSLAQMAVPNTYSGASDNFLSQQHLLQQQIPQVPHQALQPPMRSGVQYEEYLRAVVARLCNKIDQPDSELGVHVQPMMNSSVSQSGSSPSGTLLAGIVSSGPARVVLDDGSDSLTPSPISPPRHPVPGFDDMSGCNLNIQLNVFDTQNLFLDHPELPDVSITDLAVNASNVNSNQSNMSE